MAVPAAGGVTVAVKVTEAPGQDGLDEELTLVVGVSLFTVNVPVVVRNEGASPGLKRGGVLNLVRHEIEFICSPDAIPQSVLQVVRRQPRRATTPTLFRLSQLGPRSEDEKNTALGQAFE